VFPGSEHAFDEARLARADAPPRALSEPPDATPPEGMIPFNPEAFERRVASAKKSAESKVKLARKK
jgi:hypothetical protein